MFNWFSRKSEHGKAAGDKGSGLRASRGGSLAKPEKAQLVAQKPAASPSSRDETRKTERHARREQLYIAVRESMTRAGVLAASYQFKVLSLDQRGREFLVMLDLDQILGCQAEKLAGIAAIIVQTAKARFDILVTAVYWRLEVKAVVDTVRQAGQDMNQAPEKDGGDAARPGNKNFAAPLYEPIHEVELAAFKQALSATANHHISLDATGKTRTGPHSYTLPTGFEDTEMPESASVPALSNTQYGDLK